MEEKTLTFRIGQQIIYPNHGVGRIECIEQKQIAGGALSMYQLRLAYNNSTVLVPTANVDEIGLRLPITAGECEIAFAFLSEDFPPLPADWKIRFKEYSEKLKRGALFEVADVYKKLTFLSRQKPLSFREQRLLEKAHYLVVSELSAVCSQPNCQVEQRINQALDQVCAKHQPATAPAKRALAATIH